ncbi:MAG: NAD(+)/NADH kinase [Candidatus Aenigmarchaeota archaeon]|nr:NAD(+)/NADH kinase [Candidatus Aenigmarchaeota archaeon]
MKIWVHSYHDKKEIEKKIRELGAKVSWWYPDFIICYGGDGTVLEAERSWPGVPKIPIKFSKICAGCKNYKLKDLDYIIPMLERGEYDIGEKDKVEAVIGNRKLVGLNEVQVHNAEPFVALRFSVSVGKKKIDCIGDGVVVSTPYGSGAYYHSITRKSFSKGIYLAFNNTTVQKRPINITGKVKVKILRENALLVADNRKAMIRLKPGDEILIRKAKDRAKFVEI